jgi:GT2 family glycosyltransferase
MRDASVVVATSNRARLARLCVECLRRQDHPRARYEVIVVDDGSTDDTPECLQPLAERGEIVYVRRSVRAGSGPARNAGVAIATGAIVIFVDSDAFAPPTFVAAHVAAHAGRPLAVADGPAVSFAGPTSDGRLPFRAPTVRAQAALGFFGRPFVTVNASVARDVLRRVGGFDETFGARYGWEDTELYLRLRAAGCGRVRARDAWLLHLRDAARALADRGRRRFECGVNAAMLYAKHPSPRTLDLIDVRVVRSDAWLRRVGLTSDRVERLCFTGRMSGSLRWLLVQAYLTQQYAAGLRAGNWEAADGVTAGIAWR